MATGPIAVPRTPIAQPDRIDTKKSQKRRALGPEFDAQMVNNELDYLHERLNLVVVEDPAIADLASGATLAEVITRLNLITETLRSAALLRRS